MLVELRKDKTLRSAVIFTPCEFTVNESEMTEFSFLGELNL